MKKIIPVLVAALVFLLSFTAMAHAATAVEPSGGSLLDLLQPVLTAFTEGKQWYAGCLCLVVAVALVRRYGTDRVPWLSTDAGSATLVLVGSFGATLGATLATGGTPDWSSIEGASKIAFGAAGGYTMAKHLLVIPYLNKLAEKGPKFLHAPAELFLWLFQYTSSNDTAATLAAVQTVPTPQVGAPTTSSVTLTVTTPAATPSEPNPTSTSTLTTKGN